MEILMHLLYVSLMNAVYNTHMTKVKVMCVGFPVERYSL